MRPRRFLNQLNGVQDLLSTALTLASCHPERFPPAAPAHWYTLRTVWPSTASDLIMVQSLPSGTSHRWKLLRSMEVIWSITLIMVWMVAEIITCLISNLILAVGTFTSPFWSARACWCTHIAGSCGWASVVTSVWHMSRISLVWCSTPSGCDISTNMSCRTSLHVLL